MRRRVVAVDPAAEHGDGDAAGVERAAVRLAVDPAREAADDDEPGRRELAAERSRHRSPVRRARAGADDRDRRPPEQLRRRFPRSQSTAGGSGIAARSGGYGAMPRRGCGWSCAGTPDR